MQKRVRFSIRLKLFLLVLVSFSSLISVVAWRISHEASHIASRTIEKSLAQSEVILKTRLNTRYDTIFATLKSVATDQRVVPLVVERDQASLKDFIQELKADAAFDLLMFTDETGVVLARPDDPRQVGRTLKGKSDLIDEALRGVSVRGIMLSRGELFQVVSMPVLDNAADRIRGSATMAYRLSPAIADDINTLTESRVGFYAFRKNQADKTVTLMQRHITDQTLSEALTPALQAQNLYQTLQQEDTRYQKLVLTLKGEIFHAAVHPLEKSGGGVLGFVVTLRSQTELLKPFQSIIRQVLLIGIFCLIAASVMAWWIAARISKPIVRLLGITEQIQGGGYPDEADRYLAKDEVGILYDAVFQMGNSLKNNADLENYLANIAEGLGEEAYRDEITLPTGLPPEPEDTLAVTAIVDHKGQVNAGGGERNSSDVAIGQLFADRYQIIRRVGAGSMGSVYVAKDVTLDELVALKVLEGEIQGENQDILKEEIRLARKITHRNVLRTYDFGFLRQQAYISMEYVHGYDLNDLMKKTGQLDLNIGVMLARQICSAVAAAHHEGIVHRDLNPRNMIVNKQGILKVMDFGLAIRVDQGVHASQQQWIAGTPYYLAPEQILRETLDARTDIYAIGIILFKIFSGVVPYHGQNVEEVMQLHLSAPIPDLKAVAPSVPEALSKITRKAMAKRQDQRYQSVAALQADLQALDLVVSRTI